MTYDLIVIGGGPAGYLACERAAHEGFKVVLFEARNVGGVCLNEGCIPTKTFLYSAKLKDGAEHGEKYGVVCAGASLDHAKVVARKDKVVKMLTGGVAATLKGLGVEWIRAKAVIKGRSANGYSVEADGKIYEAARLLITTGSEAAMPPIDGLKEQYEAGFALTNREILDMKEVPGEFVVIGGGVIGLEMASYFNSAGSKVTVIEMLDLVGGPGIDSEIAVILRKNYEKKGIEFLMGCKVTKIEKDGVVYETGGKTAKVKANKALISIGRTPNTAGIGLESIGLGMNGRAIKTDGYMKTNQPNVYAAGDVNGVSMLAHTAYREAEVAVNNMVGKKDVMKYNAIPGVIYTNPEVAGVGETEQSAKAKGMDVTVKTISMRYAGRYVAENEGGDGICKLIIDNVWNKLVGVHMITNYASEIIWGADALIAKDMPIDEIKKIVFPHPTVAEIIREAIFQ